MNKHFFCSEYENLLVQVCSSDRDSRRREFVLHGGELMIVRAYQSDGGDGPGITSAESFE